MIHCDEIYSRATQEFKEERLTELETEVKKITDNLKPETLHELHSHYIENSDWDDFAGSSCET